MTDPLSNLPQEVRDWLGTLNAMIEIVDMYTDCGPLGEEWASAQVEALREKSRGLRAHLLRQAEELAALRAKLNDAPVASVRRKWDGEIYEWFSRSPQLSGSGTFHIVRYEGAQG